MAIKKGSKASFSECRLIKIDVILKVHPSDSGSIMRQSDPEVHAAKRAVPSFYIRFARTPLEQRRQSSSEEWTGLCCWSAVSVRHQ